MQDVEASKDEQAKLAALANTLKGLRDDAVKARAASGIEAEWLEDEEYYEGIDGANRDERYIKPTSMDGRVRIDKSKGKKSTRSTVFVNITRPYVNAAAAKLADMRFPTDDTNYAMMRPTPIPDLIQAEKDNSPVFNDSGQPVTATKVDENGQPMMQPQMQPDGQPVMDASGQPVMAPIQKQATKADFVREEQKKAREACEKANMKINDWLVQCNYGDEGRQVIEDSARIGTGVLKGPFPENVRQRAVVTAPDGVGMIIKDELVPRTKRISVWNLYPDGACGESIHNGKYIWEDDEINSRQLQDLKRDPSYLSDAINQIIDEGPRSRKTGETTRPNGNKPHDKEMYEIWYYTGYLSREDLDAAGYEFEEEEQEEGLIAEVEGEQENDSGEASDEEMNCGCQDDDEQFPALVVMVNDVVIKATMQTLDSGEFPYDVFPWQPRSGHWAGIGVGRHMRTEQDGLNASTRILMDNAGVSGSPILIIDRSKVVPADGKWGVGPHKVYYTVDGAEVGNIRDAFTWILSPSMQIELMNIQQFWIQRAEQAVGLPMIMQGQVSQNIPDTAKGQIIANNNGNTVLRRILRNYDKAAKAHVGRYYEWLLMYVEDDSMKGDFTVEVRDSTALIERDNQSNLLMQLLPLSLNPSYGKDPELVMNKFLEMQRFNADDLNYTEEKKQEMANRQPPPDPRVQVAQMNLQAGQHELQATLEHETQQAELDRALRQWEKSIEAQIEQAQLTGEQQMNADELKVAMAKESAKLRTQIQLAMRNSRAPQVATPAFEPQGRAPNGMAFQR